MATRIDLTFDCADATRLAGFWKLALGYEDGPPPAPFATREQWLLHYDVPEEQWSDGAWLHDPDGVGPRLSFLGEPEAKVAKPRSGGDASPPPSRRWARRAVPRWRPSTGTTS